MYKTGGLRSIFKGSVATLARDGPGSALYFATYEYLKKELSSPGEDLSLFAIMTAGGFAGVSMWLGVFPIDTIKSTQQSSNVPISILQTTKTFTPKVVLKHFSQGWSSISKIVPCKCCYLGVELARKALDLII